MIEKSTASHATQFSAFNLLTAWEQPICGDVATPLVDARTIYLACEHDYIFALDPSAVGDRRVRWRHELSDPRLTAMDSLDDGVLVGSDSIIPLHCVNHPQIVERSTDAALVVVLAGESETLRENVHCSFILAQSSNDRAQFHQDHVV